MFKIGDKVKIVGYTQVPKHLYDLYWNPDMEKYVGVTSTISEICGGGRIQIERQSLHMERSLDNLQ